LRKQRENKETSNEEGYTLIELIMTIFIMGMILLIINIVLIAIMKSSARSDTSIRLRQLVEFGFEVIERDAKSSNPGSVCIAQLHEVSGEDVWECVDEVSGNAVKMTILGADSSVVFFVEDNDDGIGILKSYWTGDTDETTTYLTNSGEIDVESFEVDISHDYATGTHEIILRLVCDSITRLQGADPLVNDMLRTATIVTKGKEL
jgi:prepilin-type N-terminal cleavage/methylation domain-containing protein